MAKTIQAGSYVNIKCVRCDGTGTCDHFRHIANGACFHCGSTGIDGRVLRSDLDVRVHRVGWLEAYHQRGALGWTCNYEDADADESTCFEGDLCVSVRKGGWHIFGWRPEAGEREEWALAHDSWGRNRRVFRDLREAMLSA